MPAPDVTLAIFLLLLTPGPSNTLMLVAAADRGLHAALRLIPAELAGYLATVAPLMLLAQAGADAMAALRPFIAVAAGLWVLLLALRLWQGPVQGAQARSVSARTVFLTTLLNPKALIFGLVLLPGSAPATGLATFAALVATVAVLWAGLGATIHGRHGATGLPLYLRRAAACWLAVLSVGIFAKGLST